MCLIEAHLQAPFLPGGTTMFTGFKLQDRDAYGKPLIIENQTEMHSLIWGENKNNGEKGFQL